LKIQIIENEFNSQNTNKINYSIYIFNMRVYLDNNIIVSIENQEFDITDLKNHFGINTEFVYSYIHIQELLEAKNRLEELKENRLETIRRITKNKHIYPDTLNTKCPFFIIEEDPIHVLQKVQAMSIITDELSQLVKNIDRNREKFIQALSIDITRINNYSEEEVIETINKAMLNNISLDLKALIDPMGLFLHEQICSIFNILDLIGFWKDKKTERSNMARMYDASHAYFAAGCDIFLSNDRKTVKKSKVAYSLKGINTKVSEWNGCTNNNNNNNNNLLTL